ncbi:unnamed protein product [Linum trigynum]|uniref:Uncharacterized protein n=1 Tax=Linum trigynum TaxID=586398 RepID=A0AAV2FR75_9ROSI
MCKARKENGGLDIRDLKCFNKALLSKWLWKFAEDRGSWWRELIDIKYLMGNSVWQSKRCSWGFGGSVSANITKEYADFWKAVYIDPGGGVNMILAESYPRVAATAARLDAWI